MIVTDWNTPRLIIFDKDNTLVGGPDGRPPNTLNEQYLLPGVIEKCGALRRAGHTLAVASNQGGVAYGFISRDDADQLVECVATAIGAAAYRFCPHHPGGRIEPFARDCACRKPRPGMLWSLMDHLGFDPGHTIYIGDQESDRQAAEAAGVQFVWAADFFGWR